MWRQAQLTKALIGLTVLLGTAHACYYQALNLENPADYYYRYCYAGCIAMKPDQAPFTACCTPLPAGATPPATCAQLSKSRAQAGTTCQWGQVPTTNFPSSYTYASPPAISSGQAAQGTQSSPASKVTVWVTSTSTQPCTTTSTPVPASTVTSVPTATGTSVAPPPPPPSKASSVPVSSANTAVGTSGGMMATWTASPSSPQPVTPASSLPGTPSSNPPAPSNTNVPVSTNVPLASSQPVVSNTLSNRPSSAPAGSLISTPCPPSSGGASTVTPSSKASSNPAPYVGEAATGSLSVDRQRRAVARSTITPAPMAPRDRPDFASGFEPVRRALDLGEKYIKIKRGDNTAKDTGPVTYESFVRDQVFYQCGNQWTLSTLTSAIQATGTAPQVSSAQASSMATSVLGGASSAAATAPSTGAAATGAATTGAKPVRARLLGRQAPTATDGNTAGGKAATDTNSPVIVAYYATIACPYTGVPPPTLVPTNTLLGGTATLSNPTGIPQTVTSAPSKGGAITVPTPAGGTGSFLTGPFTNGVTCFCYPPGAATTVPAGTSTAVQIVPTQVAPQAPPPIATSVPSPSGTLASQLSTNAGVPTGGAITVRTSLMTIVSTVLETVVQPATQPPAPTAPLNPVSSALNSLVSSAPLTTAQFVTTNLNSVPGTAGGTSTAAVTATTVPQPPGAGPPGPITADTARRRVRRLQTARDMSKRSGRPPVLVPCACDCGTVISTMPPTGTAAKAASTAPASTNNPTTPVTGPSVANTVNSNAPASTAVSNAPSTGASNAATAVTGGVKPSAGNGQEGPPDDPPEERRALPTPLGTLPPGFEFAGPGLIRRVGPPVPLGLAREPEPEQTNGKRTPKPELFWDSFLRVKRSEPSEPRPVSNFKLGKRGLPQEKREAAPETVTSIKWVTSTAGDCKPSTPPPPPPPPPPPQSSGQQDDDDDECDDSTGVVTPTPSTVVSSSMLAQGTQSVGSPSGGSSIVTATSSAAPYVGDGPRPSNMGVDNQRRARDMAEM